MNKTTGLMIVLLFILIGILTALLFMESNETKKYKETLHKMESEVKSSVEELEREYNSIVNESRRIQEEYHKVNETNELLQKKIEELEKENIDLKNQLEAKLEKQKQQQMAMNTSGSSSSNSSSNASNTQANTSQTSTKTAYLTFDDGPSANTEKILDTLKEHNIKATFFVNGKTDSNSIRLYKRIVNEGHSIGNHIYSHNYSQIYKSKEAFMESLYKLENHIKEITGVTMDIVRYPGGSNNSVSHKYGGKDTTKQIARELVDNGYVYFDWNVDLRDADAVTVSESKIIDNVLTNSKNQKNAIILFHDFSPKTTTASALPKIIKGLKEQGFQFDRVTKNTYAPQFLKP